MRKVFFEYSIHLFRQFLIDVELAETKFPTINGFIPMLNSNRGPHLTPYMCISVVKG